MFSLSPVIGGTLITAAVLAGVAPANADIGITTQNVRYTLPPVQARHDIRQAANRGSVLFTQEMGRRQARRFAPAGWGVAHAAGTYRGDCATFYRRDVWRLRRAYVVRVVDVATRRPSNGHRWALVTVQRARRQWRPSVSTCQPIASPVPSTGPGSAAFGRCSGACPPATDT